MQFISTDQIEDQISQIKATHIAVAYIGSDWKSYTEPKHIQQIIVSPTLGSNPFAIQDLVNELGGWDRIFFLGTLHSKIYIGNTAAAFGSFNLSRNGISSKGLEEFGATTHDPEEVSKIAEEFHRLLKLSKEQYPTTQSKKEALHQLHKAAQQAERSGITLAPTNSAPRLIDYSPLTNKDFYIVWYRNVSVKFDEKTIAQTDPNISLSDLLGDKIKYSTFLESDDIQPTDWLLLWRATEGGLPDRRIKPYWIHVGSVIPGVVDDAPYTKLVVEYTGPIKHDAPFTLDAQAIDAILKTLSTEEFPSLRPDDKSNSKWGVTESSLQLIEFINSAKRRIDGASKSNQ